MTMHVAVSGWLLGEPSGANARLLALLEHAAPLLADDERITVLHRPDYVPPRLPRIEWRPIAIPAGPVWTRAFAERRHLAAQLAALGATGLDHGFLPLPALPIPICLLLHDLRHADGMTAMPRWFARMLLRRSCRRAAAIAVPSRFTAQRLREVEAPIAPVHVIPNGVVMPASRPRTDGGHLLHVGHLEPRKNLSVLLHALALLPEHERPALQLVGKDAGCADSLRALAAGLGIAANVHLRGRLDAAATNELYATARAVVVPSQYEGFGLAALEGLAHGCPTLVADAGALPEVVGDGGVVLPATDAAAWARAIVCTAVDAPEDAARRRRRAAQFPWTAAASDWLAVWRNLSRR